MGVLSRFLARVDSPSHRRTELLIVRREHDFWMPDCLQALLVEPVEQGIDARGESISVTARWDCHRCVPLPRAASDREATKTGVIPGFDSHQQFDSPVFLREWF